MHAHVVHLLVGEDLHQDFDEFHGEVVLAAAGVVVLFSDGLGELLDFCGHDRSAAELGIGIREVVLIPGW